MRKLICILIVVLLCVGLVGCNRGGNNRPENIRQEYYEHGLSAIELIDDYFDGDSSYTDMKDKLDEIRDKIYPAQLNETSTETLLKTYFAVMGVTLLSGDDDELLELRNEIAELINEEIR